MPLPPLDDNFAIRADDLRAATQAEVLSEQQAGALATFVLQRRRVDDVSGEDEALRLITGFSDIFVSIGIVLLLGALSYLLGAFSSAAVAVAAWGLAEIFTRQKRMALPSILLMVAFVGAVYFFGANMIAGFGRLDSETFFEPGLGSIFSGLVAAAAAALHWRRFHVPVTLAAGWGAVAIILGSLLWVATESSSAMLVGTTVIGLLTFALAMGFDMGDKVRRTQRADIAFWLHLLAAPMIVHPVMTQFIANDNIGIAAAAIIFAIFAVLAVVALVVDRRALLVSSLLYLGYALTAVITKSGLTGEAIGVAILLVGATVLVLSLAWRPLRRGLLHLMPIAITSRVPVADATYPKPVQV